MQIYIWWYCIHYTVNPVEIIATPKIIRLAFLIMDNFKIKSSEKNPDIKGIRHGSINNFGDWYLITYACECIPN